MFALVPDLNVEKKDKKFLEHHFELIEFSVYYEVLKELDLFDQSRDNYSFFTFDFNSLTTFCLRLAGKKSS